MQLLPTVLWSRRYPWLRLTHFVSTLAVTACGCVFTDAAPSAAKPQAPAGQGAKLVNSTAKEAGGRVAPQTQQVMLARLAADPAHYSDAWGLFSEGGWANAGQVMVYANADRSRIQTAVIEPEGKDIAADKALSRSLFDSELALPIAKADQLADIDEVAFDALTFEYVHAQRGADGKVHVVRRVFIRNTGRQKAPDHDALIAAMQKLRPSSKPASPKK